MLRWHPPRAVLDLAEMIVSGVLADWPSPITVPAEVAEVVAAGAPTLELEDAEGTPVVELGGMRLVGGVHHSGARLLMARTTRPVRPFTHGPVRAARLTPAQVHQGLGALGAGPRVLAVAVRGAVSDLDVRHLSGYRGKVDAVVWLALVGVGQRQDVAPEVLLRGLGRLAGGFPVPGVVVPVALPASVGDGAVADVAEAYGATQLAVLDPVLGGDDVHEAFAAGWRRLHRPASQRGITLFFTGLSGSGKSTVAKALADRVLAQGDRTLTMLDGDEVRRLLSHGLTFSRADRDLNIRRIGYVAAEVTKHGGMAVCAPIAPFAKGRREVREMVEEHGDFVLVHVSTPLAECERRDRKGLYAKARAGEIPEFTGISSPYEVPDDAELIIDTTGVTIDQAVDQVWSYLSDKGYLSFTVD